MHLLLLTPGFPDSEENSTCFAYIQAFLKAFIQSHPTVKITVVSFHFPFVNVPYNWHSLNVIPLNGANKGFPRSTTTWIKAINLVKSLHRKEPFNLIHSFFLGECALVGTRLSSKLRIRHICTVMGTEAKLSQNKYLRFIKTNKMEIVVPSEFAKKQMEKNIPNKAIHIISFGLNKSQNEKIHQSEKRVIDIISVGSFNETKDIPLFLEVVKELHKTKSSLNVKLVGDGIMRGSIEKIIRAYNLENVIELTGAIPNDLVHKHMRNSKILLHTSSFEAQGFVFLEALQNGLTIISKQVGIASLSERWKIAHSKSEFVQIALNLLELNNMNLDSINLYPVQKTVMKYASLYQLTNQN